MNEFRFNEDKCIQDLFEYIKSTYNSHYALSSDDVQPNDLIISNGDGEAFFRSNVIKYVSRMNKKGTPKKDLLKAMHYCVLLYNIVNKNDETI